MTSRGSHLLTPWDVSTETSSPKTEMVPREVPRKEAAELNGSQTPRGAAANQRSRSSRNLTRLRTRLLRRRRSRFISTNQSGACVERWGRGQRARSPSPGRSRPSQMRKSWRIVSLTKESEASRDSKTTSLESLQGYDQFDLFIQRRARVAMETRSAWPRGRPTEGLCLQVLCVRNLSRRASVAQLVALFSRFQREEQPPVVYRLLTGRMKGQAFITLPGQSPIPQLRTGLEPSLNRRLSASLQM